MVSLRCKLIVKSELEKLGLSEQSIELGMVEIHETPTNEQLEKLKTNLLESGLELLDDKKSIIINRIKSAIIDMVHYGDELPTRKLFKLPCRKTWLSLQIPIKCFFGSKRHHYTAIHHPT